MASHRKHETGRRTFLLSAGALAAVPLLGGSAAPAPSQRDAPSTPAAPARSGRRRLGSLEVSSVGLGVQNMSRTYQKTIPSRPEMIHIIRAAFERGVTFFDAAEAYGPHEVERILGEGVAPFRDKVVIASKFGWNIDLETGERRPGLNSRPEHIKAALEGADQRLAPDDGSAHRITMPVDVLRQCMSDEIRAVFEASKHRRRSERCVDRQHGARVVRDEPT